MQPLDDIPASTIHRRNGCPIHLDRIFQRSVADNVGIESGLQTHTLLFLETFQLALYPG